MKNSIYSTKGTQNIKDLDSSKREVAIYLAKFDNIDSDYDVIKRGAFTKSLKEHGVYSDTNRKIQFLRHHDWTKQIGKFVELKEDEYGLFAIGKLGTSSLGEDAWRDYEEGIIREHSIGFQYIPDKMKWIEDDSLSSKGYTVITEVKLYEGSAVTFGANDLTEVVGIVKGQQKIEYVNNLVNEFDIVIKSLANGKGTDERLYQLEMKSKYLVSQLAILTKSESNQITQENNQPLHDESSDLDFDWNKVINYLKI